MSDLTLVEKKKFEQFLGMSSGYVLNFSNRELAELVKDTTGRDIFGSTYDYGSGSKANRLRAFWQKENNETVGRLMSGILDLSEGSGSQYEFCRLVANRLLASGTSTPNPPEVSRPPDVDTRRSQTLATLKEEFLQLAAEADRSKAGFALEKVLNRLFSAFDLEPRGPFRIVGEQIDGSFQLDGEVYLVESKWENRALPEADLLVFRGKIEGKSTFTRGVFIALNDVTEQAREAVVKGKSPSFFIVNGHDLLMILSEAMSLTEFLRRRMRLLAEEGRMCVPFTELNHVTR